MGSSALEGNPVINAICGIMALSLVVAAFWYFCIKTPADDSTRYKKEVVAYAQSTFINEPAEEYDVIIEERNREATSSIPDAILKDCSIMDATDKGITYSVRLSKEVIETSLLPNISTTMDINIKPVLST